MMSIKALLGGVIFIIASNAFSSEFTCPIPVNFQNISCDGSIEVKNLSDLISYKTNLAQKKGKAQNLIIDFDIKTSDLTISSPCKIKIDPKRSIIINGNLCLHGGQGIEIEEYINLRANNVRLESNKNIVIEHHSDIKVDDFQLVSLGNTDDSKVHIRENANFDAQNLFLEAFDRVSLGRDSFYKVAEDLKLYSRGDDDTSVGEDTKITSSLFELQAYDKARISKNVDIKAETVIINGKNCSISDKGTVITATEKNGSCFLKSTPKGLFSVDTNIGYAPLKINFNAYKVKSSNYIWSYGNGDAAVTSNSLSSYTYNRPGNFTATLKYLEGKKYKSGGSIQITVKEQAVLPPVASIICSTNNLLVNCNALASFDPRGQPLTYTFDFADGFSETNSTGLSSHAYSLPGLYLVKLTVGNLSGLTSVATAQVQAMLPPNSLPNLVLNCSSSKPNSLECDSVGSSDSDGTIVSYQYIFDDGTSEIKSDSSKVAHSFLNSGNHLVKLVAVDNDGGVSRKEKSLNLIQNTNPVANFTCTSNKPFQVSCQSNSTDVDFPNDTFVEYSWKINDQIITSSTDSSLTYNFHTSGEFTITFSVKDSYGGSSSITKNIMVMDNVPPLADFNCKNTGIQKIHCDNTSSDSDGQIINVSWLLDDGTNLNGTTFDHYFLSGDVHTVTLIVADDLGGVSSISKSLQLVKNQLPTFDLESERLTGTVPFSSLFKAVNVSDADGTIQSYSWKVNGVISGQQTSSLTFNFTNPGSYNLELSVIDNNGGVATKTVIVEALADTTSPVFSNLRPSPNSYVNINPEFKATISDNLGKVDAQSLSIKLKGATVDEEVIDKDITNLFSITSQDLGSTYSFVGTIPDLKEGDYEIVYDGKDFSGNRATANLKTIHYDKTSPQILISGNNSTTNDPNFKISLSVKDASPVVTKIFHNGKEIVVSQNNVISYDVTLVSQVNTFEIQASDSAGNISEKKSFSVYLNSKPVVQFTCEPNYLPKKIKCTSTSYDMDANDKIAEYSWTLGQNDTVTNLTGSFDATVSAAGIYNIQLEVKDSFGAVSSLTKQFTLVDNIAPVISFQYPTNKIFNNNNDQVFSIQVADDEKVNFSSFSLLVNEIKVPETKYSIDSINNKIIVHFTNPSIMSLGSNTITAKIQDAVGNSTTASVLYQLSDIVPPQILVVSPLDGTHFTSQNGEIIVEFENAEDANWNSLSVKLDDLDVNPILYKVTGNKLILNVSSGDLLAEGSNNFVISMKDFSGNQASKSAIYYYDQSSLSFDFVPESGTKFDLAQNSISIYPFDDTTSPLNWNSLKIYWKGIPLNNSQYSIVTAENKVSVPLNLTQEPGILKIEMMDSTQRLISGESRYSLRDKNSPLIHFSVGEGTQFLNNTKPDISFNFTDESDIKFETLKVLLNNIELPNSKLIINNSANSVSLKLDNSYKALVGLNKLEVRISDIENNEASGTLNFSTIDSEAPSINFSPVQGSSFYSNIVSIVAELSDESEINWSTLKVAVNNIPAPLLNYYIDNSALFLNLNADYSFELGNNTVSVNVEDIWGNSLSSTVNYNLLEQRPIQLGFSPDRNSHFKKSNPTINTIFNFPNNVKWETLTYKLNDVLIPTEMFAKINNNTISLNLSGNIILKQGLNKLVVEYDDLENLHIIESVPYFLNDIYAPVIALSPVNGTILSTQDLNFNFSISDIGEINNNSITVVLNGVKVTENDYAFRGKTNGDGHVKLIPGTNTLQLSVKDQSGNVGTITNTYTVGDSIGPTFKFAPVSWTEFKEGISQTFTVEIKDTVGINANSIGVQLNNISVPASKLNWNNSRSLLTITLDSEIYLRGGTNTINVMASDLSGHTSSKNINYKFTDSVAPFISFLPESGGIFTNTNNPGIKVQLKDLSDLNFNLIEVWLNNQKLLPLEYKTDQDKKEINISFIDKKLAVGTNTLTVKATDVFSNQGTASATYQLIDTISPLATFIPSSGTHFSSPTQTIKIALSDLSNINWSSLDLKLNGTPVPAESLLINGQDLNIVFGSGTLFSEGLNTIVMSVEDDSGNKLTTSAQYTMEDIFPASFEFFPASGSALPNISTPVSITISDGSELNFSTLNLTLNGLKIPASKYTINSNVISLNLNSNYSLRKGLNRIEIGINDIKGNSGKSSASYIVNYSGNDNTAPTITISPESKNLLATPDSVTVNVVDASGVDFTKSKFLLNGMEIPQKNITTDVGAGKFTVSLKDYSLSLGHNTFTAYSADVVGNLTAKSVLYEVVSALPNDHTGPIITFNPAGGQVVNSTPQIQIFLSDINGVDFGSLEILLNNSPIDQRIVEIKGNEGKVVLNFDSNYKLPKIKSNLISIKAKDLKNNYTVASVGFDLRDDLNFVILLSDSTNVHSCVIIDSTKVKCWGQNIYGQLGLGNTLTIGDDEPPSSGGFVQVGEPLKQVATGDQHSCVLTVSGKMMCWGLNGDGRLGYGNPNMIGDNEPGNAGGFINVGGEVAQISAASAHVCALLVDGTVRCWGQNVSGYGATGQKNNTEFLGDNELPASIPAIKFDSKVAQITSSGYQNCALLVDGRVKCWGRNTEGQLGLGNTNSTGNLDVATLPDVSLGGRATSIYSGNNNFCAIMENNKAVCWGQNTYGELGYGPQYVGNNIGDNEVPSSVGFLPLNDNIVKIALSAANTCILNNQGAVKCWGLGIFGANGVGQTANISDASSVQPVSLGKKAIDIFAGGHYFCAVLEDKSLRCWGLNSFGSLGTGNTANIGDNELPSSISAVSLGGQLQFNANSTIAASFTATPSNGPSPLLVNLDASTSKSSFGTITKYHWEFGNNETLDTTSAFINHIYNDKGVYQIILTITDSAGKSATTSVTITVGDVNNPPFAYFSALSDYGVAPFNAVFDASGSFDINGTISNYSWVFGDGNSQTTTTPTVNHNYTNPGTYLVMMKIKDNAGAEADAFPLAITIKELNMSPFANFNCSTAGKKINCSAFSSGDLDGSIADYKWNFGDQNIINGGNQYETTHVFSADGNYTIKLTVTDNNGATADYQVPVVIDTIAPNVIVNLADNITTSNPHFPLSLIADDVNEAETTISINGQVALVSSLHLIDADFTLIEGLNTISVVSIDSSGNKTSKTLLSNIVLDTIAPALASITPANGEEVSRQNISIKGVFTEKLSALSINDQPVALNGDGKSFTYNYTAYSEGMQNLIINASDLAGNTSLLTSTINVQLKVLYPELISIQSLANTDLKVIGAPGATKANANISLSSGFLNSATFIAKADGSFETTLKYFTSAKITATDSFSGRTESAQLNYNVDTTLAGTIKDTDGNPLPGVVVTIKDTDVASVTTNASGIFSFANPPTGDRQLIIDAQRVPVEAVGPNRKFSIMEIPVSIGTRQANVLNSPIYLAPLMYDGSETTITNGISATVESAQVEGVAIEIPSSVQVSFPEGNTLSAINVTEIPKDKTTVPVLKQVEPQTVVALEPSGLSFSEPVQLTLPNTNEFPAGMQLMIYSKNSKTGKWEIDGVAKVDEDGEKIVTQEGMGITHFSEVYAAPMGLKYSQINSQDKPGADTFNGAVSTSIDFPGYKSLGTEIAPKLLYRSNWAHPTATVTNIFDIPDEVQMISTEGKRILAPVAGDLGYIKTWVVPESVDLTFIAGDYHSEKMSLTGIPNKAVVSLGMDFKNQNTGVIPFAANYEIHLKRMVIRTDIKSEGSLFNQNIKIVETPAESFPETIPSELRGQLYIQNKSKSSLGRGWMIGGVQKIVNPGSSRLMLEEDDGSVSTYVTDDKIQTVAKINEGFSGLYAQDLNQVIVAGNNNDIYEVDLDTGTKSSVLTAPQYSGTYRSTRVYGRYECTRRAKVAGSSVCVSHATRLYCQQKSSSYTLLPTKKYAIPSPTGSGYILASEKGTITFSGGMAGKLKQAPTSDTDLTFCSTTASCSGESVTSDFASGNCPATPASSGLVYDQGFDDGPIGNARFNTIKSLSASKVSNGFAVADYGNHSIRFVNLDTQTVSTIAGNGKTEDSGDGGLAKDASLYHPLGTAYDSNGNLYVSTENGYIRKIDTSGKITKIAGNPNGIFYDQAKALDMYLSRPYGLAIDQESNSLFVADSGNHRILKIDLTTGMAKNVAGNGFCQTETPSGEVGGALNASLCNPEFISLDDNKNLVIADTGHKTIRRVIFSDSANGTLKFDSIADDGSVLIRNLDGTYVRTFRSGVKISFDKLGKHITSQDRLGKTTSNLYDTAGKLVQQIDPVGGSVFYAYDSSTGLLQNIRYGADGRQFTFIYDFNKDLKQVFYPDGTVKQFDYEADGLLSKETDQKNHASTYVYNNWKRLQQVIRPDGKTITINDSQSGNMANNYTGGTKGVFKTQGTEANQLIDGIKDAKGITTSFVQDETGYVSTIIDGAGKTTKVERDLKGRPLKITRPDTSIVEFTYDQTTGDLLSKSDSSTGTTETYNYDSFGNLLSKTDGLGRKIINTYDDKGLLTKTTNEILGTSINYLYNSLGLLISQTDSLGQTASVSYDARGNVTQSLNPEGKQTNYFYNSSGLVQKVTDANANNSLYEYDSMNRLLAVTTSENQKTQYEYQETGELTKITDPYGKLTNFYYDNLGQLTKKIGTRGEVTELTYDENGNTVQEKTPSGQLKHFYYDNLNQLVRKLLPDDDYNFTYDVRGNVTSVKNLLTKIDISYQHFDGGDVISQIHSYGIGNGADLPNTTLSYNYNDVGEKVGMATPKGSFQYGRDAAGRLRSITNHKGEVFTMKYDLNQRLKEITTPATISTFSFDQSGFNTQINHTRKSGATIEKFIYGKDEVGNRISKTTSAGVSTYNYDKNYQLLKATTPNLPIENFAYDSLGNRTSDNNSTYTYDQSKQQVQEDYKYLYTFDANGNMTSKQEKGFTGNIQNYDYSSENQMRSFKLYKNGQLAREAIYTYDALGRRIEKEVVDHEDSDHSFTKRFAYDGSEILFELDDNNSVTQTYTHSTLRTDDPLAVANASGTFYFVKDGLGSITDITDDQGFKVQHYEYSAFGKILAITDANGNDVTDEPVINQSFSYTGREYDKETDLYYYRARYYDANIGRFLQVDPDAGRMSNPITHINKYSYVGNNPANLTDSSGRSFLGLSNTSLSIATGFLTGSAAIGGVVKMYQKNPQLVMRAFVYTAIIGATIATGGLAPVLIGAALGGTIGYFASGRKSNGAIRGMMYGALGGGLGSAAAVLAGSSIWAGVGFGAAAGATTSATGSLLIDGKRPTAKGVVIGAGVGAFFGGVGAALPNEPIPAGVNNSNSAIVSPTTDAAQGDYRHVSDPKFNFDPY